MVFADHLKFVVVVTITSVQHIQSSINKLENKSAFHHMQICIEKCSY